MKTATAFSILVALIVCGSVARGAGTISLAGEWQFEIGRTNPPAAAAKLPQSIHLPGTMDQAGLGPKNTAEASLSGPYRIYDYAGPACYQREIEIPAAWRGKRVSLFLERVRWVSQVWLDGRFIGTQDSLIAPHVYDFGMDIAPGKHQLTIGLDNTVKLSLGRFVSALFGGTPGNLNGIIGRIELQATPPVWVEDVQVYPNMDDELVKVKVRIGNDSGRPGHGTLNVGPESVAVTWNEHGGNAEVNVDMSDEKKWEEFDPALHELKVRLGDDERVVRFGMRKFAARGKQFTLNGKTVFLRGTLECSVFPLTCCPPTDVPAWQRIYRTMKSYGLNFIRFHSWCPPDAAFTAADMEGIFVQVEGPMANVKAGVNPARDAFIEAEFKRIVDTYGNHPSFCLMTLGNEYGGPDALLSGWVDMLIKRDPRHLYSSPSGGQTTTNRQWTETDKGRGIHGPGTDRDLHEVVDSEKAPVVGHEIGQWMFWPDLREMKKYTGVLAPKNYELVREGLERKHLLDLEPEFVQASGRFAVKLYKEEIESLLRTPEYGGFSLLDLHDYPTQGTALVGPLDAFWDSKGFITPEAWRRFCGPTVPLLRMPKRTYTTDETFEGSVELASYGPRSDMAKSSPTWRITDEKGRVVAYGVFPSRIAPAGRLEPLGTIKASLANVPAPCKLNVSFSINPLVGNDWDIWVYPAGLKPEPPPGVVRCRKWDEVRSALAAGSKVVFFANSAEGGDSMAGRFLPVFWSPVWFPKQKPNTMGILCDPRQPLLAHFPTESCSDWQWYGIMEHSRLFVLDDAPAGYRPLVEVIDNFARNLKLGLIFEGRAGRGQLLVCGANLPEMPDDPAAQQLLAGIYAYASSPAFKPSQTLSPELLEKLFAARQTQPGAH